MRFEFRKKLDPVSLLLRATVLLAGGLVFVACDSKKQDSAETSPVEVENVTTIEDTHTETGDLPEILKHGKIRFILPKSNEDDRYLPRQGFTLYHEAELASMFAKQLGLRPEWVFVERFDQLIPLLLEGKSDIIVGNMTVTETRKQDIAFSVPVAIVKEQVVMRANDILKAPKDLVGRRIAVQESSAFWETAQALQKKYPGIHVQTVPEDIPIEAIINGVADNTYDVTIADSNYVQEILAYQEQLKSTFAVSGDRAIAWGVRPDAKQLKQALNHFINQQKLSFVQQPLYKEDLPKLKQRKVLRVITRNNAANYFLWRGELLGFEYELAKKFAKQQGLRLQMVVPPSRDNLLQWLVQGKGDLVAASLTINPEKETGAIKFSRRINTVSEVVVTRADDESINELDDLAGRTIYVRPSSSYWQSLLKLKEQGYEIEMKPAPENLETEEIITKVASGEYDITVSDSHILDIELTWRDDIKGAITLGDPVEHGWVVRAQDEKLLEAVNAFIKKEYRGTYYNLTHQKYFQRPHTIRKRLEQRVDRGNGMLSPYDDIVKKHAHAQGFDWRLITAQMYQESRFDPKAKSWAGAQGLMQVMPRTARELGVKDLRNPEKGIEAGVRYLAWLRDRFEPELSVKDRMWFALASYNAGAGHVRDARRLAKRQGWESNRWFDNVERAMLLLSKRKYAKQAHHGYVRGSEPVKYVREIKDRYQAYLKLAASP